MSFPVACSLFPVVYCRAPRGARHPAFYLGIRPRPYLTISSGCVNVGVKILEFPEDTVIQVIPFRAEKEPLFLPLLARGLSDLSVLRLNALSIQAQVNVYLELDIRKFQSDQPVAEFNWNGQELWFTGMLQCEQGLEMVLVLYDPGAGEVIYRDAFQAPEEQFLAEWEERLQNLLRSLHGGVEESATTPRMYTRSLDAFLAFRRGLEILSQAKNESSRGEGLESLLQAVAYDPGFLEAIDILLLFLMQSDIVHNYDYSISILERLHLIAGNHPRIPLVMAEVYYQLGNKDKTEQLLKNLVQTLPQFTEGWIRLAFFYHTNDQPDAALETLQSVLAYEPHEATVLDMMGAIHAGRGENELARKLWLEALETEPSRVNILNNLALLSEEQEDLVQAELYYQQALKVNNEWWGSYFHYGTFCFRHSRYEEAAGWLAKAAELNPVHPQTFQNYGLTLIKLGRFHDAQENLLRLLQLAPDNLTRRQTLQLLNQLNDPAAKTEVRIRQLEKLWDNGERSRAILGMAGQIWKARHSWYYWYLWGRIFEAAGIKLPMRLVWSIAMNYGPGFPLLKKVGLYYWEKKRYRKALPMLRKAFELHQSDPDTVHAYFQTLFYLGEVEELQANMNGLHQQI